MPKIVSCYNIIENESEIKKFFNKIFDIDEPCGPDEVLFLSLASRIKYATPKQKEELVLNRTMMLERKILRGDTPYDNYNLLIRALKNLETYDTYHTVRSKKDSSIYLPIPENTFAVYMFVNPMNIKKAYANLKSKFSDIDKELFDVAFQTDMKITSEEKYKETREKQLHNTRFNLKRLDKKAKVAYSQSESKRRWFDIDLDFSDRSIMTSEMDEFVIEKIKEFAKLFNLEIKDFYILRTYSGYHIGYRSKILQIIKQKEGILFVLNKFIELFKDKIPESVIKEMKYNEVNQIPIAGTFQGSNIVRLIL